MSSVSSTESSSTLSSTVLSAQAVCRSFEEAGRQLEILNDLSLEIEAGETLAIIGASGSGKSTLLNLLAGLDQPNSGEISVEGQSLSQLSERQRAALRNQHIGFVFQFHHLLPEFSATENVAVPALLGGSDKQTAYQRAQTLLERVGLSERAHHRPAKLSGGERQRVAIARALANQPSFVLMDEPTGNLDPQTAQEVESYLFELNRELGIALVMVTHDHQLASRMDRTLVLSEGRLKTLEV